MGLNSLARLGYLARATVYFLIGGFAILAGIGSPEGAQTDSKGVLRRLMEQPFGHFLLFLLAIGLFSYAIWRFSQSFFDAAKIGTSRKAIFKRIGYAFGGMTHTLLGIFAIKLIFAIQPESSDSKAKNALAVDSTFWANVNRRRRFIDYWLWNFATFNWLEQ